MKNNCFLQFEFRMILASSVHSGGTVHYATENHSSRLIPASLKILDKSALETIRSTWLSGRIEINRNRIMLIRDK